MPIPISIAILIALFVLGGKMNKQPKGSPAEVVILGGKQYSLVDKKDSCNTLVVMNPKQNDNTVIIKGQRQSAPIENIFQFLGLYQIIKAEPLTPVNNSINSNIKQAVCL
ncbi:hypothetical protein FAM09_06970 [Niastella caeni]|uniref:Uncharacterized protein n=1 Tax=Niastella caeni TaxID=2569763 RepID=A0A4S8I103_9BACT|nr:hypothetical protein [Niastella caeni]THU41838.1 hypothetical protein FAM09_06970 [Niastella caeni]